MNKPRVEMVITDLDGTLLSTDHKVSDTDLESMRRLGESGVVRVIATGRSYFSLKRVLPPDFPVDYLIFSSGSGIMEWESKSLLYSRSLSRQEVLKALDVLKLLKLNFMIHEPIPDNHIFSYHCSGQATGDFDYRISLYQGYASPMSPGFRVKESGQILVIVEEDDSIVEMLKSRLSGLAVIRTTSPLDGRSIWIEIFPEGVSKSQGARWLCRRTGIPEEAVMAVGNDYNDMDLLEWSCYPFVTANAPDPLKSRFPVTSGNNESGFSRALERVIPGAH
jgi:Cof subfamily protein (haloacid dehalogenase superfamily)